MSNHADLPSDEDLLLVSLTFGELPNVEVFADNAAALRALARHATFVTTERNPAGLQQFEESSDPTELRVARTSLTSTWDVVFAAPVDAPVDAAAPAGSGAVSLYALQQLLLATKSWQARRHQVARQRNQRDLLSEELHRESFRLAHELASPDYATQIENYGSWGRGLLHDAMLAAEALADIETIDITPRRPPGRASGDPR